MSKLENVKEALSTNGDRMSDKEIAKVAGCSESFVYKVRKGKYYTPRKDAKAQAIAKNKSMPQKKRGRPAKAKTSVAIKVEAKKEVSIREAIDVMLNLVASKKDLFVSFDSKRYLVEMMWKEEVFQVPPAEVEQTLSAMKYLEDRELKWQVE